MSANVKLVESTLVTEISLPNPLLGNVQNVSLPFVLRRNNQNHLTRFVSSDWTGDDILEVIFQVPKCIDLTLSIPSEGFLSNSSEVDIFLKATKGLELDWQEWSGAAWVSQFLGFLAITDTVEVKNFWNIGVRFFRKI